MKVTVKDYLYVRAGKPGVNRATIGYMAPGTKVEIDGKTYQGDTIEGNNLWYRDEAGNFLWSGGFEHTQRETLPWWITDFGIDALWQRYTGKGITLVFIDSGIAPCSGIDESRVERYSILEDDGIDTYGHGTLMASIATGSDSSLRGVASHARIVSIKITNCKDITVDNFLAALALFKSIYRDGNRYILNCSCSFFKLKDPAAALIEKEVHDVMQLKNVLVCAASGNDYQEKSGRKTLPASCPDVVSVAGFIKTNGRHERLTATNYWNDLIISAPAEFPTEKLSRHFNRHIDPQGSSHACAFMSGLMALHWSSDPGNPYRDKAFEFLAQARGTPYKFISKNMIESIV